MAASRILLPTASGSKARVVFVASMVSFAASVAGLLIHGANKQRAASGFGRAERLSSSLVADGSTGRRRPVDLSEPSEPLLAKPTFSYTDEKFTYAIKSQAITPDNAIAWARSQNNAKDREHLISAIVRAWAEVDPVAAVSWALAQHDGSGASAMEAAVTGAVRQPAIAIQIGRTLLAENPITGAAYGTDLVGALTSAGEFRGTVQFIQEAPAELQADWITVTFQRWAAVNAGEAVGALNTITAEPLHNQAFQAVVAGWAASNPAELASYAASLPAGVDRAYALDRAVVKWSVQDPAAMAAWVNTLRSGPEYDMAVTILVLSTDQANRGTEVALRWVESISDPGLRRNSLRDLLPEWHQTDPEKARSYVASSDWLEPEERLALLQSMEPVSDKRRLDPPVLSIDPTRVL